MFEAIITKRVNNIQTLRSCVIYPTRKAANKAAEMVCKTLASVDKALS